MLNRIEFKGLIWVAYIASIWSANWMIQHVGDCIPDGPCVIPVGFGLSAPSGVLMIGGSLVLRDAIHEIYGRRWVMVGIIVGAALSAAISPALALASGVAFAVSELGDFAVYEPLRQRSRPLAIAVSGTVGGAIDSALFLMLAFGSLDYFGGQFVGKTEMALLGAALLCAYRVVKDNLPNRT
jgi:hypothetical protein